MNKNELIKDSIDYIENRIRFTDQKASVLMAIELGIVTASLWAIEKLFGYSFHELPSLVLAILSALGFYSLLIQVTLLQTVRPVRILFSNETSVQGKAPRKGIMWPKNIEKTSFSDFTTNIEKLSEEEVKNEYVSTLYSSQFLVNRKYQYYRKSLTLIKWQVILNFTALIFIGGII